MEKNIKNGMRTTGRLALDRSECKAVFSAHYRCFEVKNEGKNIFGCFGRIAGTGKSNS